MMAIVIVAGKNNSVAFLYRANWKVPYQGLQARRYRLLQQGGRMQVCMHCAK